MKRSEINDAIECALSALRKNHFVLPPFGYWTPSDWAEQASKLERIRLNGLGWDITDFGSGDFDRIGAVLVTMRNGNLKDPKNGTPYAEKAIIMKPGQCIPLHFHWIKTEDIINRGGGTLVIQLYNALDDESVDMKSNVEVYCDGIKKDIAPGELLSLAPGESITLTPRLYHKFWARENDGVLICGEVSSVNDDSTDNRFAEPVSRFAEIEEDDIPIRLLCNEYPS
jgi:hypothetical protein